MLRSADRHQDRQDGISDRPHAWQLSIDVEHQPADGAHWPGAGERPNLYSTPRRGARSGSRGTVDRGGGRRRGVENPRGGARHAHREPRTADAERHEAGARAADPPALARRGPGPHPPVLYEWGLPRRTRRVFEQTSATVEGRVEARSTPLPQRKDGWGPDPSPGCAPTRFR